MITGSSRLLLKQAKKVSIWLVLGCSLRPHCGFCILLLFSRISISLRRARMSRRGHWLILRGINGKLLLPSQYSIKGFKTSSASFTLPCNTVESYAADCEPDVTRMFSALRDDLTSTFIYDPICAPSEEKLATLTTQKRVPRRRFWNPTVCVCYDLVGLGHCRSVRQIAQGVWGRRREEILSNVKP